MADVEGRRCVEGQRLIPRNVGDKTAVLDAVEEQSHVGHASSGIDDSKGEPRPSLSKGWDKETGQHLRG